MVFRGAIQAVIFIFKTLWEQAKFSFGVIYDVITTFASSAGNILSGVGDIIKGVFTGSWDGIKKGWKKVTNSMGSGFDKAMDKIQKRGEEFGKNTAQNFSDAVNNTMRDKVEFVTEEDIQNGVDGMMNWAKEGLAKVKEMFASGDGEDLEFEDIFGDAPIPTPSTTTTGSDDGSGGGGDSQKEWEATLSNQKSALRSHLEGMGQNWKNYFSKQDSQWLAWGQKTQEITMATAEFLNNTLGSLDAIAQQRHENKMIQMDNEYNQELSNLENRGLSEAEFKKQKEALDAKYADKKKQLEIKQAKREKRMALFKAIIGTAQGIAGALPNIPLSILAGVLGAAQIAAIASQPIPMAKGALAYSPTNALVGDNVNAQNDPEVIAPLSKLTQILGNTGQNVRVTGQIQGNEIFLSSEKAQIGLSRYA